MQKLYALKKRKISQVQLVPLYFGNITRAQYGDRYSTLTSYQSVEEETVYL